MDNSDSLIQILEKPLNSTLSTPILYQVKSGDTLSKIIKVTYDIAYNDPRYKIAQASVLYFNDSLRDPNEIKAGQLLRLMPLADHDTIASCPVPDDFHQQHRAPLTTRHVLEPYQAHYLDHLYKHVPSSPQAQEAFWALAWLQENYDILSVSTGAGFTAFGGLASQANTAFMAEVKNLYQQKQRGSITEGQYKYRRQKALNAFAKKLGPFEKMMFKGKTVREAVRIQRSKALPATANIDKHIARIGRMANYAKHGGVILSAAGVGMGCYNISQTQSRQEKNEIFVETLGSTLTGGVATLGLALVFASGPVGWTAALVYGAAAAGGSFIAGKGLKALYTTSERKIDLVSDLGVDRLCR
ncbi:MAG: LysM peptidoglycan-binding domain-containing protein [Cellvibrionaceae bacterium]